MQEYKPGYQPEIFETNTRKVESPSILKKLESLFKKRFGRRMMLTLGLLTLASFGGSERPHEHGKSYGEMASTEITLSHGEKIKFADWQDLQINRQNEGLNYSDNLKAIIESKNTILEDLGLYPIKIENGEAFTEWVLNEISTPQILEASHIKSLEEASSKNLVEIAVAVAVKNLTYSKDVQALEQSAQEPVDQILKKHLPAECSHYSVATQAIFESMKKIFPERLKNIYLNTIELSPNKGSHFFNKIIIVEKPNEADVSYVDPTAADVSWGEHYISREDFSDLLSELRSKAIITTDTYYALIADHQ